MKNGAGSARSSGAGAPQRPALHAERGALLGPPLRSGSVLPALPPAPGRRDAAGLGRRRCPTWEGDAVLWAGSRAAVALIYVKSLQLKRFVPRGASLRRSTLGKPGWAPPALAPTSTKSAARGESGPGAEAPPRHPAPLRHLRGAQAGAGLAPGRRRAAGAGCPLPLSLRPLGAAGAARPGAPELRGLGLQQPKECPGGGERLSTWWEFLSRVWGVFFTRNGGGETLPSFLAVSCSLEEEPRGTGSSGCLSAPDSLKRINRFL